MTTKLLVLCLFTLTVASPASAQANPDVGSAVVKFLLGNPKRADRMSTDQRLALDILSDLLSTEGQRQHQLNYAAASRNQITINTQGGGQAQLVRNEAGGVFLLVEGVIYPIATELVNQALAPATGGPSPPASLTQTVDLDKIKKAFGGFWTLSFEGIRAVFAFAWFRDVAGNGAEFEDFHGIANAFYDSDNFKITGMFGANKGAKWEIEIVDERSGEIKLTFDGLMDDVKGGAQLPFAEVTAGALPPGNYVVYAKLHKPQGRGSYAPSSMRIAIVKGALP